MLRIINKMRLPEITLMTGFGTVAVLFFEEPLVRFEVFILVCASYSIVASIYSANSFFGFKADLSNPRFKKLQFKDSGIYIILTLVFLLLSLFLWYLLRPVLIFYALAFFFLWLLYSVPGGAKYWPILGTVVHLVGVILQFHMASIVFESENSWILLIASYFALLFAGGHVAHEIKDYDSDKAERISTNAVYFGMRKMTLVYYCLILMAATIWTVIGFTEVVSGVIFWAFETAIFFHLITLIFGKNFFYVGSVKLQTLYRIFYLFAGVLGAISRIKFLD